MFYQKLCRQQKISKITYVMQYVMAYQTHFVLCLSEICPESIAYSSDC